MSPSPLDRMITSAVRCVKCGARHGACSCWGGPAEQPSDRDLAELTADAVIRHMREMYPEPMRYASGGFRKTLRATIIREAVRLMGQENAP